MYIFAFLCICLFLTARTNTTYNRTLRYKRYRHIENSKLSSLLISRRDVTNLRKKNRRRYKHRILIAGIVFYILLILYILVSLWLLLLADPMPITLTSINIDKLLEMVLNIDTLNLRLVVVSGISLIFFELAFNLVNTYHCAVLRTGKKYVPYIKALYIFMICVLTVGSVLVWFL